MATEGERIASLEEWRRQQADAQREARETFIRTFAEMRRDWEREASELREEIKSLNQKMWAVVLALGVATVNYFLDRFGNDAAPNATEKAATIQWHIYLQGVHLAYIAARAALGWA